MTRQSLVGKIGTVINRCVAAPARARCGSWSRGMPHYYLAYAAVPVPAGTEVLVINNRGARQVDVEPWPRFPADGNATGDAEGSP